MKRLWLCLLVSLLAHASLGSYFYLEPVREGNARVAAVEVNEPVTAPPNFHFTQPEPVVNAPRFDEPLETDLSEAPLAQPPTVPKPRSSDPLPTGEPLPAALPSVNTITPPRPVVTEELTKPEATPEPPRKTLAAATEPAEPLPSPATVAAGHGPDKLAPVAGRLPQRMHLAPRIDNPGLAGDMLAMATPRPPAPVFLPAPSAPSVQREPAPESPSSSGGQLARRPTAPPVFDSAPLQPAPSTGAGSAKVANSLGPSPLSVQRRSPSSIPVPELPQGAGGRLSVGALAAALPLPDPIVLPRPAEVKAASAEDRNDRAAIRQLARLPKMPQIDAQATLPAAAAYSQRDPAKRGGSPRSGGKVGQGERMLQLGLAFLAGAQFPDGHFSLDKAPPGFATDASASLGSMNADTAATGLALLAFLGAGYTQRSDQYQAVVDRSLQWLLQKQGINGDLFVGDPQFAWYYSHAIATMALCEAYGMTKDPRLLNPARRAVVFLIQGQNPQLGGWRYRPATGADTSVSGWALMALKSAQMAGIEVPQTPFSRLQAWLDVAQAPGQGGKYVYNPYAPNTQQEREGRVPNLAMSAEGLLMRIILGWGPKHPGLEEGLSYFETNPPQLGTAEHPLRDAYYWYYATQVMFHTGGPRWTAWNATLSRVLEGTQVREGPLAGSWDPQVPVPDRWGAVAGRLYLTCLNLLMLEVSYRHLPWFGRLPNVY